MLTPATLDTVQRTLGDAGLDGWLLFDFRGTNPIASSMLGLQGMLTRRLFAWIPRSGKPVAVMHAIEQGPWRNWPKDWGREVYASWRTLEAIIARLVGGKRVAMEYSPGDAVPYLDRIPGGVIDMVRAAGATIVPSGELVTRFYAVWNETQVASHLRASEIVAQVARDAMAEARSAHARSATLREHELRDWIVKRFESAGLETEDFPIVAAGANAADPHYGPSEKRPREIREGDLLLIDLWAREPKGVYADQTWMGTVGAPSSRAIEVWEAVRDARDASIALLRDRGGNGSLRGGDVDTAARRVINERGLGDFFVHRTGHSIDPRDLHGSGPHIDDFETREERLLLPGVGFSIEPGVYLPGELGVRSEVNAFIGERGVTITPQRYQRELIVL
ncbi:MAG: Xaa-Pro peptidase family protein [Gemmatimonadota bacterium]|nr:Xaa-Pro peptidase family protein [Gemmatimonadota bacterium]